ncbi:MAG: hypothetical protein WC548_01620 [Candidatus Pacearchaeota archaeon]
MIENDQGRFVVVRDVGLIRVEDWRRTDMPDSIWGSYESICALSNDLTDKLAGGEDVPISTLGGLKDTVEAGLKQIREQYQNGERNKKTDETFEKICKIGNDLVSTIEKYLNGKFPSEE